MDNYYMIQYISHGESSFNFSFPIKTEVELQVLLDYKELVLYRDYNIVMNETINNIELYEPAGSHLQGRSLIMVYNPTIMRITNFTNNTEIKASLINDEFNNIINNERYIRSRLDFTLTSLDDNVQSLVLPPYEAGKSLVWFNKSLSNSQHNLDEQIDILLEFMNDVKNGLYNTGGDNGENGGGDNPPLDTKINAINVIYSGNVINANNVEQCLNLLTNPENIKYFNTNLKSNSVKEALDALQNARNISYSNNGENISNVAQEIMEINNKIDSILNGSMEIPRSNIYTGATQCILESTVDGDGLSNHITCIGANTILISTPLVLAFSHNNRLIIKELSNPVELSLPDSSLYYIYATLGENNVVSIGYTKIEPRYLYFNPILAPQSNLLLINPYMEGDFFHIPSSTMFTNNGNSIKRVYIGQVEFNQDGTIKRINNYIVGNSYSFDVEVKSTISSPNKHYLKLNRLGTDLIEVHKYFKHDDISFEGKIGLYANNTYEIRDVSYNTTDFNQVSHGTSCDFSSSEVWGVVGSKFTNSILMHPNLGVSGDLINQSANVIDGFVRIYLKRSF